MKVKWYPVLASPLLFLSSCFECDCSAPGTAFCDYTCNGPAETGGEEENLDLPCTFEGICILDLDPADPILDLAIEEGLFKPYTWEGACPNPARKWQSLGWYFPSLPSDTNFDDAILPNAAYCPNMDNTGGYEGPYAPNSPTINFPLCWPEKDGWIYVWEQGKVARPGTNGTSDCESLDLYGNSFEWDFELPCSEGVYCLGLDEECVCRCPTGEDSTCSEIYEYTFPYPELEGEELICEGFPLRVKWNEYIPTGCVWNGDQGGQPLGRPWHKFDVYSQISCSGSRRKGLIECSIGEGLQKGLLHDPEGFLRVGMTAVQDSRKDVVIFKKVEPASIAGSTGFREGDQIQNASGLFLSAFNSEKLTLSVHSERDESFVVILTKEGL